MFRLIVCLLAAGVALAGTRYDNYKVFEITGRNENEIQTLRNLEQEFTLDVWRVVGRAAPGVISVGPEEQAAFIDRLDQLGIDYTITENDVQSLVNKVDEEMAKLPRNDLDILNTYLDYTENKAFLSGLLGQYGRMHWVDYGKTYEGRDLFYIKLTSDRFEADPTPGAVKKPVIWMECTTHAREWISNAVCLNFINWLVTSYGFESEASDMLDAYDWYFVPVHNPDGYAWSHHPEGDRMWRKTVNEGRCSGNRKMGVDPNRNWAHGWGVNGDSTKCSDTYQGPGPLSEPETGLMSNLMMQIPEKFRKAFISVHSFGQMILYPYGYDRGAHVETLDELIRVADLTSQAIYARSSTTFRYGKPGDLLYDSPGGSDDHGYGFAKFNYSYTFELHPTGWPYFQLPPSEIERSYLDFRAGMYALADQLK